MKLGRAGTIAIVVAATLFVGWIISLISRPDPAPVAIHRVASGTVADTVANTRAGTIEACRRAGISPRLGGQIAAMPVTEGDVVSAGQVLMEFWNDDLAAQERLAQSELRAAESRHEQACIVSDLAAREARRQRQLRQKNLASEEAVDSAESQALAKQAACAAARSATDVSRAQLEVARAALDQTRLRAPFSGIIAEVNGEVGEFVTPSPVGIPTPPAVDLMDISCLYVSAPIDEVDAPDIGIDMRAYITLDAFPGRRFPGRVRRVAPYVLDLEKQARTVEVEVEFTEPADCDCMLPGYTADVEIILAENSNVLRIPSQSLLEGDRVLLVDEDDRIEERTVTTGLRNWDWTEIREGLRADDQVVTDAGTRELKTGDTVAATAAGESDD